MKGRKAIAWIIGAGLTAAACVIQVSTPSEQSTIRAIIRSGESGHVVESRLLAAELIEGTFADEIVTGEQTLRGNWLILTVSASARSTELYSTVDLAAVTFADKTFVYSDQVDGLREGELRVGVPTVGILAFELSAALNAGHGKLILSTDAWVPELDDVIEIHFDATDFPRVESLEITDPRWEDAP